MFFAYYIVTIFSEVIYMERHYLVVWKDKNGVGYTTSQQVRAENAEQAVQIVKRTYPNRFGELIDVREV